MMKVDPVHIRKMYLQEWVPVSLHVVSVVLRCNYSRLTQRECIAMPRQEGVIWGLARGMSDLSLLVHAVVQC